jgi:hypothetical protein
MSKSDKGKGATASTGDESPDSLSAVFDALEEKVDALSKRVVELSGENRKLRAGLEEAEAAGDRLRFELMESIERLGSETPTRERLALLEEERTVVRTRIESLIKSLDGASEEDPTQE